MTVQGNVAGRGRPSLLCLSATALVCVNSHTVFKWHCSNEACSLRETQAVAFLHIMGLFLSLCVLDSSPLYGGLPFVWTGAKWRPELTPVVTNAVYSIFSIMGWIFGFIPTPVMFSGLRSDETHSSLVVPALPLPEYSQLKLYSLRERIWCFAIISDQLLQAFQIFLPWRYATNSVSLRNCRRK
jgi:hypothetical protein